MADDLNKKIKQITDLLGQENLPENIMGLLSLFAGAAGGSGSGSGSSSKDEAVQSLPEAPAPREEKQVRSEPDENADTFRRIKKVLDKVKSADDPRINLLFAIKPFLNSKRRKKLETCISLLHMTSLAKLVDDRDK